MPKRFFKVLERHNMQNQAIFVYTDDNKSKYSSNPQKILKSSKKKKALTKQTSTDATTEFLGKILNRK